MKNQSGNHIFICKFTFILLSFIIGGVLITRGQSVNKLPKTEILGKEYYVYEIKKGESVYGIAKRYDWNLEELLRLNPDASGSMQKGDILYYPTGNVTVVTEMPKRKEINLNDLEPIKHKVKKGETVYSISRQYNIPLEIIYKNNPNSQSGIKTGEIIVIPQNGSSAFYYYTVKNGDTLSSISQTYNTSVEDILKDNPGLTVNNFQDGETIRLHLNSNEGKVKTKLVAEERISSLTSYKVSKHDTWENIAEKTGVEVDILKQANENNERLKENTIVTVPVIETVEVESTVDFVSEVDMTKDDVQELYDSIKGIADNDIVSEKIKVALILDEPSSKKDIDFTRGFLIALRKMKDYPVKIDLKVLDGRVSSVNLVEELDLYEPDLLISTADKAFPVFLADYGNTNNIQIVNVFDIKNDLYEDNPSVIQILPPSAFFNDRISSKLYKDNKRRKLIGVGEIDPNDGIAASFFNLYEEGNKEQLSLEEFGSLEPDIMEPLIIYSYATKKEEVSDFLKNIESLADNFPGFDFKIIGRSNWISMTDDFGDKFNEDSVTIPARIWLEEDSDNWKDFTISYEEMYEGYPVRSIPNFAASGFDMASYFIPAIGDNKGDFNRKIGKNFSTLQTDINLIRTNNWGGFINGTAYLLQFHPDGKNEKIIIK